MIRSGGLGIHEKDIPMSKSKTVILWGREDPLGEGAELFLARRKGWEVIHITDQFDANYLLMEVERLSPEVVIIHQGDCADQTDIPAQLMKNHPSLKVITVSLENNSLEVYSKQKFWVKEVSDLLSIVDA
jgi:hypothetical protein